MAVQFGLVRETGTYGYCEDVETTDSAETATWNDADGDVGGYKTFGRMETIRLNYVYRTSLAPPAAGATMTINTNKYVVDEVRQIEATRDFRKVSISGSRWVANTIPA